MSDDGNQTCTGEALGPIKIKRAGRKGGTRKGVWKVLLHDVERRTRGLWYLETKVESVSRRRKSSAVLNVADRLRKMSRLRLTRICFRETGRREIGNSTILLRRMGTEKQGGSQRRKSERFFCLCLFCVIFPVLKITYLCVDGNDSVAWGKTGDGRMQGELGPKILSNLEGMRSYIHVGWLAMDRMRDNSSFVPGRKAMSRV